MSMFDIKYTCINGMDVIDSSTQKIKTGYRCGIIMPVYNRYPYLRLTLFFLKFSNLENYLLVFVDDTSDECRVIKLINQFRHKHLDIMIIRRKERPATARDGNLLTTLHKNLSFGINYLFDKAKCPYVTVLDSDAIVKPQWLNKMLALYYRLENNKPLIVSGFNTMTHETIKEGDGYYHKDFIGGISMLFNRLTYNKIITPLVPYWDDEVSNRMLDHDYPMVCIRPSSVQHIGFQGFNSRHIFTDISYDFFYFPWLWILLDDLKRNIGRFLVRRRDKKRVASLKQRK